MTEDREETELAATTFKASDGLDIAYYIDDYTDPWKSPQALLLLHAAMGHSARFYAWVPKLARHYRVIRMDLRGHGASQVPPATLALSMDRLVLDVGELLDHLGCTSVHIVGNSAGGYVAQNLAIMSPERIRSLALFGSTPGLKHSQAATWLPRVAKEGLRSFLADTISDRFPIGHVPDGLVTWFIDEAAKNDPAYIGRFIGLMTTLDWSDQLNRIKCPTLVVMPGGETVGSLRNYDVMLERIKNVQAVTYEGLPHNICDSVPDRCVEDLMAFLHWHFGLPG
jgi:pimeloyl-ACP methyl ester carboxylesterase